MGVHSKHRLGGGKYTGPGEGANTGLGAGCTLALGWRIHWYWWGLYIQGRVVEHTQAPAAASMQVPGGTLLRPK